MSGLSIAPIEISLITTTLTLECKFIDTASVVSICGYSTLNKIKCILKGEVVLMCIIMYSPSGKSISENCIKNAFENNPDGGGIMWYDKNGNVHYKKGFDKVDDLVRFYNSLNPDLPRAVHCRIATSGKISTKTCHPFPIVEKISNMGNASGLALNGALMHNGIFSRYTPTGGMNCDYSDTMNYTAQVIFPLVRSHCIKNEGVINLLQDMTSRVLLFLPKFQIMRFGTWVENKEEGFFASNSTYEKRTYAYSRAPYYYGSYGWGDDYDYGYYTNHKTQMSPVVKDVSTTYTNPYSDDEDDTKYLMSIIISASNKKEAEDLVWEFLDEYYPLVKDEDMAIDSLAQLDVGVFEFVVESSKDLNQVSPITAPYSVSYCEKYTDKEVID